LWQQLTFYLPYLLSILCRFRYGVPSSYRTHTGARRSLFSSPRRSSLHQNVVASERQQGRRQAVACYSAAP
jgi:hypothetical protein